MGLLYCVFGIILCYLITGMCPRQYPISTLSIFCYNHTIISIQLFCFNLHYHFTTMLVHQCCCKWPIYHTLHMYITNIVPSDQVWCQDIIREHIFNTDMKTTTPRSLLCSIDWYLYGGTNPLIAHPMVCISTIFPLLY